MILDIAILVYLVICIITGLRQGAALQLFSIVGIVVASLLFSHLGAALGPVYGDLVRSDSPANFFVAAGIGSLLVLLVFVATGHLVRHFIIRPSGKMTRKDRSSGAAMSLLFGLVMAYLVACVLDRLPDETYAQNPWLLRVASGSRAMRVVRPVNVVPEFTETLEKLHLFNKVLVQHYPAAQEILERPAVKELVTDETFRRVLEDARDPDTELHRALRDRDFWWLMNDKRIVRLLTDPALRPKVRRAMEAIELEELKRIARSAPDPGYDTHPVTIEP